jgi:hypothetical protein
MMSLVIMIWAAAVVYVGMRQLDEWYYARQERRRNSERPRWLTELWRGITAKADRP